MRKEIEIQQENVDELIKLMKENPTLRVLPMVNTEVVADDNYSCWLGKFGKAEIDECWSSDERIYFKSWDEEDLVNDAFDNFGYNSELDSLSNEKLLKMAEEKVSNLDWEKVIVVKIDTP